MTKLLLVMFVLQQDPPEIHHDMEHNTVVMSERLFVHTVQELVGCRAESDSLRQSLLQSAGPAWYWLLVGGIAVLAAGFGAGWAVHASTTPR